MKRRHFLSIGSAVMATSLAQAKPRMATPSEVEGPFYPVHSQTDKDADLTQVQGQAGQAQGQVIELQGQVVDVSGQPLAGAKVDLWQANAAGKYHDARDPNPAEIDPGFQGWAVLRTDESGRFALKTIFPGAYPASRGWSRPPHIHFKLSKPGYRALTTQMYFPDHPLNGKDRLLQRLSKAEQAMLIAKQGVGDNQFEWQIALMEI
ncbi:MAG: protocatechuate 3,4-dioxygenase [Limnobacter sp.]|nr:protocatechuate 3,4-dioxygenase [Limnobacter sp.]